MAMKTELDVHKQRKLLSAAVMGLASVWNIECVLQSLQRRSLYMCTIDLVLASMFLKMTFDRYIMWYYAQLFV